MSQRVIRILQLHNLRVGSGLSGEISAAILRLPVDTQVPLSADYIVACGNYTTDRSDSNFATAIATLRGLAQTILPSSPRLPDQVILVPGPLDVPNPNDADPDYSAFQKFYANFYKDAFGVTKEFCSKLPEVIDHIGLTLIGLAYWRSPIRAVNQTRMQHLANSLSTVVASLSARRLAYVASTPTIMISSESPLFHADGRRLDFKPAVQDFFCPALKISSHLFGVGPLEHIAPIPFGCEHSSFGLGQGLPWPLRVNLIEIATSSRCADYPTTTRWTACRLPSRHAKWETLLCPTPQQPAPDPQSIPSIRLLNAGFFSELRSSLDDAPNRMVHIMGFPGAGIRKIFECLSDSPFGQIAGRSATAHTHMWASKDAFTTFLRVLGQDLRSRQRGQTHILLIYHPSLSQDTNREGMPKHLADLVGLCPAPSLDNIFKMVYITDFVECTIPIRGRKELPLLPLDGSFSALLNPIIHRVPLHHAQVLDLTGGYAGLSEALLRSCEMTLATWDRVHRLDDSTSAILLQDSFDNPPLPEVCHRFRQCIEKTSDGPVVFEYIRLQVLAHYVEAAANTTGGFGAVVVAPPPSLYEGGAWKHLRTHDIIERIPNSLNYRVRVVAPFLDRRHFKVFVSYNGDDSEIVHSALARLRDVMHSDGYTIEPWDYQDELRRRWDGAASTTAELQAHLAEYPNLLVFLTPHGDSDLMKFEREVWTHHWGRRRGHKIGVALTRGSGEIAGHFEPDYLIFAENLTVDQHLRDVSRRLRREESTWGFRLRPPASATADQGDLLP